MQKLFNFVRETFFNLDSVKHSFYGLYESDIGRIKESINHIFCDLPTIQSVSIDSFDMMYMTQLISLCINQIILSTERFLTDDGTVQFWAQPKTVLIAKLDECLTIKDHVIEFNRKMKNILVTGEQNPLQFLDEVAFMSLILFFNRLQNVRTT